MELRQRVAAAGLLGFAAAVICVCFLPGQMGVDTVSQIIETDNGDFTNRHAPLLLALWRPLYELGAGPGFVLAVQVVVFLLGGYLVLRAAFGRLVAAAITAAISLSPPVFGMLGFLSRDTWFAALLLLAFGLAVRAAQREWPARGRWIAAAIVASWLALAARQNAAAAIVVVCAFLAYLLLDRWRRSRRGGAEATPTWRSLLAAVGAGAALTAGLLGTQIGANAALGVRDVNPEQYLYMYDLAALSAREGENLIPPDVLPRREMEVIEQSWSVDSMVLLVALGADSAIVTPLGPEQLDSLRDAWLDEVSSDPGGYLAVRNELFLRQLALTGEPRSVLTEGISDNPFGYEITFPAENAVARDYLGAFTHTEQENLFLRSINGGVLYTVWIYLLIAAVVAIVLLRRGVPLAMAAVGALALSAITLQVGLYLGAMGTEWRFEFPGIAAVMFAVPAAIAHAWAQRATPRHGGHRVAIGPREDAESII